MSELFYKVIAVGGFCVSMVVVYLLCGCAGAAQQRTGEDSPVIEAQNTFQVSASYDDTWTAVSQAMRRHKLESDKDTGIIRTEPEVRASDLYSFGLGSGACEVYSWVVSVSKTEPVSVTVERDIAVYDAAYGSIICNDILSDSKSSVYVGSGITMKAQGTKSIANPRTSWRMENLAKGYLQKAVNGGKAGGRMPVPRNDS